ncbi:MAG: oligosaccharide flippase family protein [Candidatus Woesearchaeota archaeon]
MDPDKNAAQKKFSRFRGFFNKINSQDLLKNVWQVGYAAIIIAVLNIFFQFFISRTLGPVQYGEIETLITINSILLVALAAIAFIVTRFVSLYKTREQYDKMRFLANWAFGFFFLIGFFIFMMTVMFSKVIAAFLNISDYHIIIVFGLLVWVSFMIPIIEGILRGLQDFKDMGKYKVIESIFRTVLAVGVLLIGLRIKSVLFALALGSLLAILLSTKILKSHYIAKANKFDLIEIYKFTVPVFIACLLIAVLSNIDLVLVKHLFPSQIAGFFAAASMLAKIAFGIAFGIAGVMFPKIVEDYSTGNERAAHLIFRHSLEMVIASGTLITLVIAVFPNFIGHLIFGKEYIIPAILGVYALALFFLSVASVYVLYDLAIKKYFFIPILLLATIIEIIVIMTFAVDVADIIWTLFVINSFILLFMICYNWKDTFKKAY